MLSLLKDHEPEIDRRPHERLGNAAGRLAGLVAFAATVLLAFPSADWRPVPFWGAAALTVISMGVYSILPLHRVPRWMEAILPMIALCSLALFVQATGGYSGGFAIAMLGPIIWFALFGNAHELFVSFVIQFVIGAFPIYQSVFPELPDSPTLRVALVWTLMFALVASLIHQLVQEYLVQLELEQRAMRTLELSQQAMVHDLQGPLSMSQTVAVEAAHQLTAGNLDHVQRMLEALERSITQSRSLVDDVLTLHRVVDRAERTTFDPVEVVEDAASTVQGVELSLESMPLRVTAYRTALVRAFRNLLENAEKYGREGADPVHVAVSAEQLPEGWTFRVVDDGPGFRTTDLPTIFEPFRRGTRTAHATGHGLGLSIVRACAQAHGGDVVALNRPGGGACVELTIANGQE